MTTAISLLRSAAPDATPVTSRIVEDELGFQALREEWERIVRSSGNKNALFEWNYLMSWWTAFGRACPATGRSGNLHVLVVSRGRDTIGILPFFYFNSPKTSLRPKRLRPIGYAGRLEPYDLTEEPLVAITEGETEIVLNVVANEIRSGLEVGTWDCAILRWFGDAPAPDHKYAWTRFTKKVGSAYVALPTDWASFRKGLSKSMRDNLPYYGRLLTRHGHRWCFETAEIGPDWDRALEDLERLHKLRACMSADPNRVDHFTHSRHTQFLDKVHNAFRGDARAYIGMLRVDGKVVAAQLFLDDSTTLVFSYSGHDPAWSRYSPLLVLQAEMIKLAIDRGVKRLNLLCGEADWQERWKPTRDYPINKLTLASKRPLSTARCALYVLERESTIWWHKTRLHRWIQRKRIVPTLQSFMQACYVGQYRHLHLILNLHRMRTHF